MRKISDPETIETQALLDVTIDEDDELEALQCRPPD